MSVEGEYSTKLAISYSLAGFTDVILFQFFTFLIFTFYYAVIGLNVNFVSLAFVIWSIWNALNDPILGELSDRTRSKWGRRKPWIIGGIFPLIVINVFLWIPPAGDEIITFLYFLIIIIAWEFFYTMWSLNQTALFPEIFHNLDHRARANTWIQFFQILSLMIAFLLPSLFIPEYSNPLYVADYPVAAIVISIICLVSALLFIKWGLVQRPEFYADAVKTPSLLISLKFTLKNKAFVTYLLGQFALWYAFGMLPTIIPLYGQFVLNVTDSTLLSLLLAIGFISAAFFIVLWRGLIRKLAAKNANILALLAFSGTLAPFMFINDAISGLFAFVILGFGLAGALIVRDVTIAAIIDEDELKTGVRREGAYYGINGFIAKLTNVFIFLTISLVFNSVGWAVFDPLGTTEQTIFGLRSLMFIYPTIFLAIGTFAMVFFPINKQKYEQLIIETRKLHDSKKESMRK